MARYDMFGHDKREQDEKDCTILIMLVIGSMTVRVILIEMDL